MNDIAPLKHCPFCGAGGYVISITAGESWETVSAYVGCAHCDCRGPEVHGKGAEELAAIAWNERAPFEYPP